MKRGNAFHSLEPKNCTDVRPYAVVFLNLLYKHLWLTDESLSYKYLNLAENSYKSMVEKPLMALKTNVKIFRCRVSSSLRIFKHLNIGKEGAEKSWTLMHHKIFFWSRSNGVG